MSEVALSSALVAVFVNVILSFIIPRVFSATSQGVKKEIRDLFESQKEALVSSCIIVFIAVYIAVTIEPAANEKLGLRNLAKLANLN
jgi:Ca2+/H+ antiporter